MRTYEALAMACRDAGVAVAFGLVGDGNVKFAHHLSRELDVRYVAARHESGAVCMAAGFARASGGVGFVTVTQGPGLTNAVTALTAAAKARLPLVLFAGEPPTGLPGHPQRIDQQALLAVAGVVHQPLRPERLLEDVEAAFDRARAQRRPVGMFLATDLQDAPLPPQRPSEHPRRAVVPATTATGPLEEVAARLCEARRPVILAGRGCLSSPGAREALIGLADEVGALLATTLPIRGYFASHPFSIGVMGGYTTQLSVAEAEQADVVIAFGASLNYRATRSGKLFHQAATIVQVDLDPSPPGASIPVDLALTGDAAEVADRLRRAVMARGPRGAQVRTAELADRLDGPTDPTAATGTPRTVHPARLMQRLNELLPTTRSVTVDGGHSSGFPSIHLDVPDHHGYLFALEFAAIGLGLGTALGAAVARPERTSVLVVGDGSLLMSLPELETAVREGIPVIIVVMNDQAYGSELVILDNAGLPPDLGLLETPSFAAVATAMGARGETVRELDDLEALAAELAEIRGPLVIDAHIDPEVRGEWLAGAFDRSLVVRA